MTHKNNSTTNNTTTSTSIDQNATTLQFQFVFDKVILNQRTMKLFKEFLMKSLHSPEAILFYEKVLEFKSFEGQALTELQTKLAQNIVERFIVVGSAHEINIGKRERNQVLERVKRLLGNSPQNCELKHVSNSKQMLNKKENESDEHSETSTNKQTSFSMSETSTFIMVDPINIFDEALVTVKRQLKEDVFPLFLRSDRFLTFCKKASRETLGEIGYERRQCRQSGNVSIEDFWKFYRADCESLNVNGQDVKFLSSLSIDSSDWTLLEQEYFKKSCFATFVSSETHCMIRPETSEYRNPNSQHIYKCTGVINHSTEKTIPLNWYQWAITISIGFISIPYGFLVRFVSRMFLKLLSLKKNNRQITSDGYEETYSKASE
ncbi:predicted protein [Naegleria gruberi]|uniref:Predicted protein n=1 Tax=Naegleria gruberi TaxID=5762 RepID=D2W4A1_NAEGR|nr:uncharacterized protein NAEGRDRAFT_76231 [Naegleria gruberi]EFC36104.1 predicted protein [Naegleria gruberi]|eukprot:XP_002668848.1 predicted protein [Naegleria gruberi strain NEG-M]